MAARHLVRIGLAAVLTAAAAQTPGVPESPIADHHMHLRSPAVSELFASQLPVVRLPADLEALLREFEGHFRAGNVATPRCSSRPA